MRLLICVLAAAALQSQPAFRSGVDLIRLDVSVVDKDGRPVSDLAAGDFVVTIDGAPRRVAFARYYDAAAVPPIPAGAGPTPTYATNRSAPPGRVVVIVADLESMTAGYEKVLLETAASLVDRLAPVDAAGLLPLPGKGIELTRDHARVREAIGALRGFAPKIMQRHVISMADAAAFERGDRRIIAEVIDRECRPSETECPMEIRNESRQLLFEAHRRIQQVLNTLSTLNSRLQSIQAPKDVVLLSAGLPFDQESISYFQDLGRRAAESGTAMHVVRLAQPETDAAAPGRPGSGSLPDGDLRLGLSTVASVTGGDYFEGVGRAKGVFERIGNEITHSWQLGIEATPQDTDGKAHKIGVSSTRAGLTVRARREAVVASAARPPGNPIDLLAQPADALELPIAAATYSVRGDEAATLKQIILVQAAGIGTGTPPNYALAVMKDERTVFQTDGTLSVAGQDAQAVMGAQLPPGRYRLRVAVVDAAGRGGSLEMPLGVGLRAGGPFFLSDVFAGPAGDRFQPATQTAAATPIQALIELYTADGSTFAGATVEFELRRSDTAALVSRAAAAMSKTDAPGRRIAEATLATANAQPGAHTVSALVSRDGAVIARVSRMMEISR